MTSLPVLQNLDNKDMELSSVLKNYCSVEFSIRELSCAYQFKLWDEESDSVHIVIKEDSDIMNWIKVGNSLESKFYPKGYPSSVNNLMTRISHIEKANEGRFKGHYIVGISV